MRCLLRMNDSSHEAGNVITSAMLAQSDGQAGELLLDIQKQCLLRVVDTCAKGFVITKPMLAKSERHESKRHCNDKGSACLE